MVSMMTSSDKSSNSSSSVTDDVSRDQWLEMVQKAHLLQRMDMNKLIMDYLVTEGFKEAAEKFQDETGLKPSMDLDSLDDRIKIRESIQNGRVQEAISMVNKLHPELLDNNKCLHFHLQQQHLIELIRFKQVEQALEFAQLHLAERGEDNPDILSELERTMALLAFECPDTSPFNDLLQLSQRQKVASELNSAILEYENMESTPKLANLLRLLLWSQDQLSAKKVKFPKITDIGSGEIDDPK